jgi:hypothetical protein
MASETSILIEWGENVNVLKELITRVEELSEEISKRNLDCL